MFQIRFPRTLLSVSTSFAGFQTQISHFDLPSLIVLLKKMMFCEELLQVEAGQTQPARWSIVWALEDTVLALVVHGQGNLQVVRPGVIAGQHPLLLAIGGGQLVFFEASWSALFGIWGIHHGWHSPRRQIGPLDSHQTTMTAKTIRTCFLFSVLHGSVFHH